MASLTASNFRQEPTRNEPDFVTVVSVGTHQPNIENFVTVLSIGNGTKNNESKNDDTSNSTPCTNNLDVHPEEEVEVFRLPGEPLGFGLKFEGGAKNAEKVKRLFVQSCAEQSPASRAKCSWGTIGEGDEVLSIDGVPVTHMSRLDCVRRLKESQLVIKLLVRCRGALRPEVVSAERKSPPDSVAKSEKKIPPELPSLPPPVPPRKLRHARGSGDGEANPIPAKKTWNGSPISSGSSSQTDSPQSHNSNSHTVGCPRIGKSEQSSPSKSPHGSPTDPAKRSPEFVKSKQEPPEAMVYLDARSQDGSSTHGSTSDDTGSSMSTVVDRFSMSDRFSTISTTSTTSGGATEQPVTSDRNTEENIEENRDYREISKLPSFEQDFLTNPSDYLLKRLANSEAVTHVESRGEAGGVIEKITAVVAPNTVLIEETLTLQPPLSFQDAPLSYGHETRPDLVYTADLAADSSTHFRPIRDEASIVECVNGEPPRSYKNYEPVVASVPPILPARNHVNRIPVNQQKSCQGTLEITGETHHSREVPLPRDSIDRVAPILPPKPLPRKDIKLKRKRPPPPPPPPRREPPPPVPVRAQPETNVKILVDVSIVEITNGDAPDLRLSRTDDRSSSNDETNEEQVDDSDNELSIPNEDRRYDFSPLDSPSKSEHDGEIKTNKVLEIIEMKKVKAFGESSPQRSPTRSKSEPGMNYDSPPVSPARNGIPVTPAPREKRKSLEFKRGTISREDSEESSSADVWQEAKEYQDNSENGTNDFPLANEDEDDDDETYRSLDEIKEDFKGTDANGTLSGSDEDENDRPTSGNVEAEEDSMSDDSEDNPDDYYWQSNLATIGEEEEISSLEYTNANKDVIDTEEKSLCARVEPARGCTSEINETTKNGNIGDVAKAECVRRASNEGGKLDNKIDTQVNGRMDNCGGDQRLPPDGDEFPATYQEYSACTSEHYQYVGTSTRIVPRANSIATKSAIIHSEIDETSSSSLTTTTTTTSTKNFTEKTGNESLKSIRIESTTKKNATNNNNNNNNNNNSSNNNNIITTSRESREKSSSYVQTTNVQSPPVENRLGSQYITSSLKREIVPPPEVTDREETLEDAKRTSAPYFNNLNSSSRRVRDNTESPVVVTEKTFEISGYYPKETKDTFEKKDPARETKSSLDNNEVKREMKNSFDKFEPDYPECPPPPLPLTRPPKIESTVPLSSSNSVEKSETNNHRKYSLNSDLWRQDDKSERSVRDKIAMFSSQSSLESPLFPTPTSPGPLTATVSTMITSNVRKLSKYKSSDDVFSEEKSNDTNDRYGTIERTRSFVDLTDSVKFSSSVDETSRNEEKYVTQRAPSLPKTLPPDEPSSPSSRSTNYSKPTISPAIYQKSITHEPTGNTVISPSREFIASFEFNDTSAAVKSATTKPHVPPRANSDGGPVTPTEKIANKDNTDLHQNSRSVPSNLTRATSFSGESSFSNDLGQSDNSNMSSNGQISRTNSLASTFRRNTDDMRRQSLNQLIEQRRKGISKLRGLVIPEKNAVAVDKPIIDLPEIKSRDSILLHQMPRASIQDKWGSQSSLASNASTASLPMKATASFKMPAPQIMSKYSPAFKRKSLAVYGTSSQSSSGTSTPPQTQRVSPTHNHSASVPDPPKSLESICSPTRSDYSFEFVSSTSVSPDTMRNRPKPGQRKSRTDYDDSDNDSAVSSSQSSISRGFSPPTSPVPSERSSVSSDRSYHTSLIMEMPGRNYSGREMAIRPERNQHLVRPLLYSDRAYSNSERSSSGGSSSGSSPNPRSPQPEASPRNSHIPQRQMLKRSSSTETNCSSGSSSTLTSGSQASAESLSRRVLKPQSVEAINRKNILASAKCRSGRDLNGSPLIQRKFSDDEQLPISGLAQENGSCDRKHRANGNSGIRDRPDVKIAYIEVTETLDEEENEQTENGVSRPLENNVPSTGGKSTNSDLLEASNDLKMWVRSEAKALMADMPRSRIDRSEKVSSISEPISPIRTARSRSSLALDDHDSPNILDSWDKGNIATITNETVDSYKLQSTSRLINEKETIVDTMSEDLITTLTTKSRSRAPINLEDHSFGRSSRQMSLEDILVGKPEPKMIRAQSSITIEGVPDKKDHSGPLPIAKIAPATLPRNNGRQNVNETWSEDKAFASKIPMPGRANKQSEIIDDAARLVDRSRLSKIPTQRPLGRRSASVTDMKKALEKNEGSTNCPTSPSNNNQNHLVVGVHHRFPSLDSSVEERIRYVGNNEIESERFSGEQFGSISSLASSTSLISQQELAQLVEDASGLEDSRGAHDVIVVLLHKENPHGSVGITLAGGVDCEAKEITVHRVLAHSIADKDGRVQRGDRILSINGRSTRGLNHRESLAVLKQPRSEVVLVVSRSRLEEGSRLRSRTESVETIVEGSEICGTFDDTAWGPPTRVTIFKDGAGLGFSLAGGRDSPLGDRPLVIKKIFTGGAAEKTAALTAGDQLLELNGIDVTRMARIEAWSLMKKLSDGEANLLVRHPATKSS